MPASDALADFWVHTVAVEPRTGAGAAGALYGPSVDVACFVDDTTKLVRATSGEEVVSVATVMTDKVWAGTFTDGARITWKGRTSYVVGRSLHDSGALDLPDHLEVHLQ